MRDAHQRQRLREYESHEAASFVLDEDEAQAVAFIHLNRLAHDIRRHLAATYYQDAQ